MAKTIKTIAFIGQKGIPAQSGGVERHVEAVVTYLAHKRDVSVVVYCRRWYTNQSIKIQNSKVKNLKRVFTPSLHTKHLDAITHVFCSTLHALFIAKVDIIHYHGVGPALLSWIPRVLKPRVHVVTTFHCIDRKHGKWGPFSRLMLRVGEWCALLFAHETITVSQTLQQYIRDVYDREAIYIPNGVSVRDNKKQDARVLQKFGLEKQNYILTVARLVPHKRISDLIIAYQKLNLSVPLVVVGGGSFTDSYLHQLSVLIDNDERINLLGEQPNDVVRALMHHCTMFVQPSISEGMPLVLLEAMEESALAIVSDIPEHKEIVQHSMNGMSFKAGSLDALAHCITDALKLSDSERARMKRAGHAKMRRLYVWDRIGNDTERLYDELGSKKILASHIAYEVE